MNPLDYYFKVGDRRFYVWGHPHDEDNEKRIAAYAYARETDYPVELWGRRRMNMFVGPAVWGDFTFYGAWDAEGAVDEVTPDYDTERQVHAPAVWHA